MKKILSNRWKITRKLGEGGCGAVYKVRDLQNPGQFAALKVESNYVQGGSVLKLETAVLKALESKPHVARLLAAAKKEHYSYIVMTLYGESLNQLMKKIGNACSVSTMTRIGIHCLSGLKYIHDIGYVHRDIKPANLAMGLPGTAETKIAHILDFGLARQFAVPNKETGSYEIRRPRARASFRGTTRYCSVATHDRLELGRVDDLWCMIYMLVEFRGPLPWIHVADKKEVGEVKRALDDEDLLGDCPMQLLEFTTHLRGLSYYSRPNYAYLFDVLTSIMQDGDYHYSDDFEWERESLEDDKSWYGSDSDDQLKYSGENKNQEAIGDHLYTRRQFEVDELGI
ncbi:hypothetical protein WR25_05696 [Diploscapter pachys]|uniref:Protein kinase domain-containing protein n=1 Tax=Diploscapter pachys TaxID=2018661 RepID=A0A2A2LIG6_9BILA|nr:hypothetical protein WR25_05696 [Diploscapter pachys]